jgi:hypothetical protein
MEERGMKGRRGKGGGGEGKGRGPSIEPSGILTWVMRVNQEQCITEAKQKC